MTVGNVAAAAVVSCVVLVEEVCTALADGDSDLVANGSWNALAAGFGAAVSDRGCDLVFGVRQTGATSIDGVWGALDEGDCVVAALLGSRQRF